MQDRWTSLGLILSALSALAACVPNGAADARGIARAAAPVVGMATFGPEGGWLLGPNGAQITVPSGAFKAPRTLAIEMPPVGTTDVLPLDVSTVGATYRVKSEVAPFARPLIVAIPFDRSQVPPHARVALLVSPAAGRGWTELRDALASGATMVAPISESANLVVVIPLRPLT